MSQDNFNLLGLAYFLLSNLTVLVLVCVGFFLFMIFSGYKSVTIKLKKDKEYKRLNKELNKQKHNQEQRYLNTLEKNIKKKKR